MKNVKKEEKAGSWNSWAKHLRPECKKAAHRSSRRAERQELKKKEKEEEKES